MFINFGTKSCVVLAKVSKSDIFKTMQIESEGIFACAN